MNDIVKQTQQLANIITENFVSSLQQTIAAEVSQAIQSRINKLDVTGMVRDYVVAHLRNNAEKNLFNTKSIPGEAIDVNGLKISADNIENGVIKKFTSTGIDDRATACQLTVLDQGTVFENTLYAPRIEIKGDAVIDGRLIINGNLPDDSEAFQGLVNQTSNEVIRRLGPGLLEQHQDVLFDKIRQEGVEIGKLKIDGRNIFEGRTLTSAILDSRLESLGVVRDLQSSGETLLSETLYVVNKKVGINTMDPSTALTLWDEEVEINLGKNSQHVGKLSVRRDQKLILGSGNHDNITLNDDGTTSVSKLKIGNLTFGSSATPPSYDAAVGTVIFNETPSLGGPLGWVSLGGARWANFGIID
jgi:hypothetical protein